MGSEAALLAGRLGQQQLLDVGDPLFVDLDAGEGFGQEDVGYLHLLADAVIVQAAQLQAVNLQQALVVGPIQHVEPRDVEPAADVQLVQGALLIGGQRQLDAAGEFAVPHADAQQILQIGLRQGEGQALLADGAIQGEGGQPQGAVKRHRRPGVEGRAEGEGSALAGLATEGAQGQRETGYIPHQRLATAGFGQLEATLLDAGLLEGPAPGPGCRGRVFGRWLGGFL